MRRVFADGGKPSRAEREYLRAISEYGNTFQYSPDTHEIAREVLSGLSLGSIRREELRGLVEASRALDEHTAEELLSGRAAGEYVGYAGMLVSLVRKYGDAGRTVAALGVKYRIDPRDLERIEREGLSVMGGL